LCYYDTIQSKYIPSTTTNAIDRKEKNIDGKVFLTDEKGGMRVPSLKKCHFERREKTIHIPSGLHG